MKQTGLLPFKNWKIYFFLYNLHTFCFLSFRVSLPSICSTILNSSENGHSCLISNISGENIQFFTTKHNVSYRLFIKLWKFPATPSFLRLCICLLGPIILTIFIYFLYSRCSGILEALQT